MNFKYRDKCNDSLPTRSFRVIPAGVSVGTLFLLEFIFNSCAVGPNYEKPIVEIPLKFKEENKNWSLSSPKDGLDKGKWWEIFKDEVLNSFIERVNISNQNIAQAQAQYEEAKALTGEAQSHFFPNLSASSAVARTRTPGTRTPPALPSKTTNSISPSLQASWEPDLWGNIRRSVEAGKAAEQSSRANLGAMKLSQQALLAQDYFQLRAQDNIQASLNSTVEKEKAILKMTQEKHSAGIASQSEIFQSETQLANAQAQASDNKMNRAILEHAIAVTLGLPPSQFSLPAKVTELNSPRIPIVIPSQLLERRPDVAQAERLVEQANAQIGVAQSAYFPTFNLNGQIGYQSSALSTLLSAPALFWSLGASLTQTLFNGGLTGDKVDYANANYQACVANYRQVVLAAYRDVEDNLVMLNHLKEEIEFQQKVFENAQKSEKLVLVQFQTGTVNYAAVLTAQSSVFLSQTQLNMLLGRRLVASVNLLKALGGDWNKPN